MNVVLPLVALFLWHVNVTSSPVVWVPPACFREEPDLSPELPELVPGEGELEGGGLAAEVVLLDGGGAPPPPPPLLLSLLSL